MDEPQIDELKELVKVSLQQAGVLGSIKAQLRAEVFKVVNSEQGAAGEPRAALAAMATTEGQVAVDLVREFLEHFQLHSTLAVFLPEACLEGDYPGRAQLAQRLGIADESGLPLLMSMMKRGGGGGQAGASGRPATLSPGTPSPVERNAGAGGSPQVRKPAAGDANNKFAFGSGADSKGGLGSLADMPALPGAGKKSSASSTESDGMSERVRKLQSLAKEGSERRSPQDENESDESLTSTTRRVYINKAAAPDKTSPKGGSSPSPSSKAAASPPNAHSPASSRSGSDNGAKGSGARNKPPAVTVELSKDGDSDYDIVEEEIDVPESDPETPSPYTGKRGGNVETAEASMSESCTEVSISDRSVDGSMALEAFDHIEAVAR